MSDNMDEAIRIIRLLQIAVDKHSPANGFDLIASCEAYNFFVGMGLPVREIDAPKLKYFNKGENNGESHGK